MLFVRTLLQAIVGLAVIAAIWAITAFVLNDPMRLPTLTAVLGKAIALASSDDYLRHVTESGTALVLGLGPALVAGLLLGAIAGLSPATRWLLGPLTVTLAAAPLVALVPAFVIWWGLTITTKAVAVFVVAAFPIMNMVMVAAGAKRNRAEFVEDEDRPSGGAAATARAVVGSVRLGVLLGVTGLVACEFMASSRGVGYFIMNSASMFDTTAMLAGIVLVVVPTVLVGAFLQAIEEQIAP